MKHFINILFGVLLVVLVGVGHVRGQCILIDTLTRESIGIRNIDRYQEWTKLFNSGVTYKGNCAGKDSYQQNCFKIRGKDDSGIISIGESIGILYKIKVKWHQQNGSLRTLQIKGKNTQYTSTNNLYVDNINISGNTIGHLYSDEPQNNELNFLESLLNEYSYIGLKVTQKNAMYIDTIFIYWQVSNPLPISLLSFTASPQPEYNLVQWTTATEKNNDLFILERSEDAIVFDEVYNASGAGNSLEPLDYEFRDYCPVPDITYYRLTQVDYDGSKTTSEIVSCIRTSEKMSNWEYFTRYDNLIQVHSNDKILTIVCSDLLGRTIWQGKLLPHDDTELNLQTPYMVHIYEDNVLVGSEKVLW